MSQCKSCGGDCKGKHCERSNAIDHDKLDAAVFGKAWQELQHQNFTLQQRITELEQENAELKRDVQERHDATQENYEVILKLREQIKNLERIIAESQKQEPVGYWYPCDDANGSVLRGSNLDTIGYLPLFASPVIQEGMQLATVFNVFHEEEFVGSFLQGSFSTREMAQKWIDSQAGNGKFDGELPISPYVLDSLLNASKEKP